MLPSIISSLTSFPIRQCLPLIFTVTTGKPLFLFRIQLSCWHILCKRTIFYLNKISLCLMELSTLACNSIESGHLARKGEQKRPQLNWCLPRQQNKVCMPCSQHRSSCFTLLHRRNSVLRSRELMYTHTFISATVNNFIEKVMNILIVLPCQMLLEDRTKHLHQQCFADVSQNFHFFWCFGHHG